MNRPLIASMLLLLSNASQSHGLDHDLVVYAQGKFQLRIVGSTSFTTVPCAFRVGSFSISSNGRYIVFASVEGQAGAGQLYLVDLKTGNADRLIVKPFYFKDRNQREEYTDPEFSPDGRRVAFAVHSVQGNDADDMVGLAGPLAMLDLASREVHVVPSTENIAAQGPAYVNNPSWSPDGTQILISFETGGAILNLKTGALQLLDHAMSRNSSTPNTDTHSPLSWWSDKRILFVQNPAQVSGIGDLFVLDTRIEAITSGSDLLGLPVGKLHDVAGVDISQRFFLIRYESTAEVFDRSGRSVEHFNTNHVRLRVVQLTRR